MKPTACGHLALTSCVAAGLLAGCGGSQPPIGPTVAPPSTAPFFDAPSWIRRGARSEDLTYVADANEGVSVFSYPQGKLVGVLKLGGSLVGECVDGKGNVFVTDEIHARLAEFAHGRTGKTANLRTHRVAPIACAIDPTTGDLAATGFSNRVNIFKGGQGQPTTYAASKYYAFGFCGYDSSGNLFIVGTDVKTHEAILVELPKGSHEFARIKLDVAIDNEGNVQWDGRYLAIGAYLKPGKNDTRPVIYRFAINGNQGTKVGTVALGGTAHTILQFYIIGKSVIVPNWYDPKGSGQSYGILYYNYPGGGAPTMELTKHVITPRGVAVSLAPQR